MMLQNQIQQMIPATDWYAVFTDETDAVYYRPLTCFALVRTDSEIEVRPMIWSETMIQFADECEGFVDLEHLDEIDLDEEEDEAFED